MSPYSHALPLLIVDDDPGVLDLLREWATDCPLFVRTCSSAFQALEIVEDWTRGIVVMDQNMPGMDGTSLCRALRSPTRGWRPHLIVLTADDNPALIETVFREGADDFVRKPVSRSEFLGRIRAASRLANIADELRERTHLNHDHATHREGIAKLQEIVGTLAHDLRTPIGALRTTAEMLAWRKDSLPADVVRGIERIVSLTIHLADTVTDVADAFVCDDLDALRNSWSRFDLARECARAMDLVHVQFRDAVETSSPGPDSSMEMHGNPAGIRRVLVNLLSNAARATESGSISLQVLPGDDPSIAEIRIADTGGGIPSELLPHLGVPLLLSSGSSVRQRATHGAGLGLAICRRIVAQHGGRLLFASTPNVGTTVTIWLRRDLTEPSLEREHCPLDTEVLA